jgi:predicted acylesterase/phospholipase RssA
MSPTRKKIGLACAGGGIEGCIYEIGALCALDEVIEGAEAHRLDVYVGVSAGALVTACLANGISARTMSRAIISRAPDPDLNFSPETLFSPAVGEFARRLAALPKALASSMLEYLRSPLDLSPLGVLYGLGSVVPVGLFDNAPLEQYLARVFASEGCTNDFRELDAMLRVVAVNVDTADVVTFGDEATAHIPISRAVQASTALPGLYVPVEIDGAYYIDGVARRTVHASVALNEGTDLLLCINPLVPVNTAAEAATPGGRTGSIVQRGLPPVLAQSFRTIVHSRMRTGFRSYRHLYPDADLILIEPTPEDYQRLFSNLFSFSNRHGVCEYAYQITRRRLREQADGVEEILGRHGLTLRRDRLADEDRTLYGDLSPRPFLQHAGDVVEETHRVLDQLETLLDRIK